MAIITVECESKAYEREAARRAGKKNPADGLDFSHNDLAERTGLEPATPGVTGRYSNQLNYRSTSFHRPAVSPANPAALFLAAADVLASPRGFEPLYSP